MGFRVQCSKEVIDRRAGLLGRYEKGVGRSRRGDTEGFEAGVTDSCDLQV